MKYTPKPPPPQVLPELLVPAHPRAIFNYLDVCPDAQTLVAYSLTHQAQILFVLPCGRWNCRYCAERKIKKLALDVAAAAPNRLLTLTVNPALYESKKHAWQKTVKQVPILIRRLRQKFGEIEYLRVTEVTSKGWPHYHLLVRSGYLPHSVVKKYWSEQTGAFIVDLRQVTKTFSAYKYLVKYLAKLHTLEWTARHVSMSRSFVPKDHNADFKPIEYGDADFARQHPAFWLAEYAENRRLFRISKHAHLILHQGEPTPIAAARVEKNLGNSSPA